MKMEPYGLLGHNQQVRGGRGKRGSSDEPGRHSIVDGGWGGSVTCGRTGPLKPGCRPSPGAHPLASELGRAAEARTSYSGTLGGHSASLDLTLLFSSYKVSMNCKTTEVPSSTNTLARSGSVWSPVEYPLPCEKQQQQWAGE